MATLLMIVAVVTTVALLVWLSFASRPAEGPAVVMDDTGMDAAAPTVTAAAFGADMQSYEGQEVNLAGVTVSNVVNDRLMVVSVPTAEGGSSALTVLLLPGAAVTQPAVQSVVDVEGRVLAKTDSVIGAWHQAGAIPGGEVRSTLESGDVYIEARAIRAAPPAGSGSAQR